jgi:hypothetical protein
MLLHMNTNKHILIILPKVVGAIVGAEVGTKDVGKLGAVGETVVGRRVVGVANAS